MLDTSDLLATSERSHTGPAGNFSVGLHIQDQAKQKKQKSGKSIAIVKWNAYYWSMKWEQAIHKAK